MTKSFRDRNQKPFQTRVLRDRPGLLRIQADGLEEAGYVDIEKGFLGRKPRTQVRITAVGRAAFATYLDALGRLIGQPPAA